MLNRCLCKQKSMSQDAKIPVPPPPRCRLRLKLPTPPCQHMAARSALDLFRSVHPEQINRPLARVGGAPLHRNAGVMHERPLARRDALELLELVPEQDRLRPRRHGAYKRQGKAFQRHWVRTKFAKRLATQTRSFNRSGRAVTVDDFMMMPADQARMPLKLKGLGSGKWKSWTPAAVQRAAFAKRFPETGGCVNETRPWPHRSWIPQPVAGSVL